MFSKVDQASSLAVSAAQRVDAICDRYEDALRANGQPDRSQFLQQLSGDERQTLLEQLLLIEADQLSSPAVSTRDHRADAVGTMTRSLTIGDYEIRGLLGRGGFGVVYKAYDPKLERMVALKVPHRSCSTPTEIQRVVREARIAGQLTHPHVMRTYEVVEHRGLPVLVSEYLSGGTLTDKLTDGNLNLRQRVELLLRVVQAVGFAHREGVIHRDLKPGNVLLNNAGEPHVGDFGLARRPDADATLTGEGQLVGTPAYMSPEQAVGAPMGYPADVYSLGVMLYEALTGERPFEGEPLELFDRLLHDEPLPPRQLNSAIAPALEGIVLKCLAKSPTDRYASAAELARDVEAFLGGTPVSARPQGLKRHWERLVRDTPHAHIIGKLAPALVALSVVIGIGDFTVAIMHHCFGLTSRTPYYVVWALTMTGGFTCANLLRSHSARPTFVERQVVQIWSAWSLAMWGLTFLEVALHLPILTLYAFQAINVAVMFVVMARLLSRKFYLHVGAYIGCACLMVALPQYSAFIYGLINFGIWISTGLVYWQGQCWRRMSDNASSRSS